RASASLTMASAARSLTEPPGLRNSALPSTSQPVISDALRSRMSGVLPMLPMKPSRSSMEGRGWCGAKIGRLAAPRAGDQGRAAATAKGEQVSRRVPEGEAREIGRRRPWGVDVDDGAAQGGEGGAEVVLGLDAEQSGCGQVDAMERKVAGIVRRLTAQCD